MPFRSTIVAATALLATASAHMIIESPVPYSNDKIDNSPITKAQYPCKSNLGFTVSKMNSMAVGEEQPLKFKGSAVHGGGSCQLSVTLDTEPTANSKFKVIKSIEGACPGVDGPTQDFTFKLPDSIPNGKATFAWTWFSKLSGQPEMYMNCAPIEVTGGASDDSKFNELPDMLIANLDDTCTSPQNFATKYPNPGSELQVVESNDLKEPTGSGCGSSGGGDSAPASSAAAGQPSAAPSSPAGGQASTPAGEPTAAPSNTGGVFAPGASSAAGGAPSSTLTTLVTVTAAPSSPSEQTPVPSVPAGTGTPAQPSSPSTGGGSSTCSQDGAIVCNGDSQFGICNNGNVVWQEVAAGTTCSNGVIQKRGYHGRIARPRAVVPGKGFTPSN